MKNSPPPNRVPNDEERRIYFAFLKQASSYTGWERAYNYYAQFADTLYRSYEREQELHRFPMTYVTNALKDQDAFECALKGLRKGDRRCFRHGIARGYFKGGFISLSEWVRAWGRWESRGEGYFAPINSDYWPEIREALNKTLTAIYEVDDILQPADRDDPAPMSYPDIDFGPRADWQMVPYMERRSSLPQLPNPPDRELLVRSGHLVPVDGIWEPYNIQAPGIIARLMSRTPDLSEAEEFREGSPNYLLAHQVAPTIQYIAENTYWETKPTTWRLLWQDDRYGDKPIPEEEQYYQWCKPRESSFTIDCAGTFEYSYWYRKQQEQEQEQESKE